MGAAPRVRCPTCKREVAWTAESTWRPFCSDRCRLIDLGAWFTGERSIAGETDETLESAPGSSPEN